MWLSDAGGREISCSDRHLPASVVECPSGVLSIGPRSARAVTVSEGARRCGHVCTLLHPATRPRGPGRRGTCQVLLELQEHSTTATTFPVPL
jgi:hypothetical protein